MDKNITSAENAAAMKLIKDWMSEPDDLGEDWWAEFEAEFERFRMAEVIGGGG